MPTLKDKTYKKVDYLDEDPPLRGQNWVCVSFLSPEGVKNCKIRGLKVRGTYATREEADRRAKELGQTDKDFDIFVGEVGKWLPWNPDPDEAEDEVFRDDQDQLNNLMKAKKENMAKAQQVQEERKREMLQKSHDQERRDETKDRLRRKHAQRYKNKRPLPVSESDKQAPGLVIGTTSEQTTSQQKEELQLPPGLTQELKEEEQARKEETVQQDVVMGEGQAKDINTTLDRIKDMYSKLSKKEDNYSELFTQDE